jgi:hypothetical protein
MKMPHAPAAHYCVQVRLDREPVKLIFDLLFYVIVVSSW